MNRRSDTIALFHDRILYIFRWRYVQIESIVLMLLYFISAWSDKVWFLSQIRFRCEKNLLKCSHWFQFSHPVIDFKMKISNIVSISVSVNLFSKNPRWFGSYQRDIRNNFIRSFKILISTADRVEIFLNFLCLPVVWLFLIYFFFKPYKNVSLPVD